MSTKDAYVAKLEAQLNEWSAELSGLKAKAEKSVAQGRIDFNDKLKKSESHHGRALLKLEELKKSGEAQWEALKTGVESAWTDFRNSLDSVKN